MARISIRVIVILNVFILLMSLGVIFYSIYLSYGSGSVGADCGRLLQIPLLATAGFALLLSVVGIIGACFRKPFLMVSHMVLMAVLVVALACLTIVVLVLTNQSAGEAVSNRGIKDHRLGNYNTWLGKRIDNYKTWKGIKSCLRGAKVCQGVNHQSSNPNGLSKIQSGCCQPPPDCNRTLNFITIKKRPTDMFASSSPPLSSRSSRSSAAASSSSRVSDCNSWKNDENVLCYDCLSCKDGFIAKLKSYWKKIAISNAAILGFFIIVLTVGCCALRNIRGGGGGGAAAKK